jgi:HlyD family secretion protein
MRSPIAANAAQARQTKQRFARPDEQLSYELGKAVQELPPLYTRLLASTMSVIVFGAIAWAHFSLVDEVATASGELVASTQVRPVRATTAGSILSVLVKEGDRVEKDQVLIQRDPDLQKTDVLRLAKSAKLIQEDLQRLDTERLSGGITTGVQLQDELIASRLRDFEARKAAAEAEANRQIAVIEQAKARMSRLEENRDNAEKTLASARVNLENALQLRLNAQKLQPEVENNLALAKKREASLRTLVSPENAAVPRLDYLDSQERMNRASSEITRVQGEITRTNDEVVNAQNKITEAQDRKVSLEKDMAAQLQEVRQAQEAYQGAVKQVERLASERQSEILTQMNRRKEELTNVAGQLEQARKQQALETIQSPVSGSIYSVKATKGPVQPGEELLSILPDGEELLLEVKVTNRDIGFIRKGMKTKVKMATFPFQEFGTIEGEVVQISPNAIADKDLGPVFPTRIKIFKNSVNVRGKEVKFTPGMVASGEIVTRKKSVLTYIIEPVTRRFVEALSVR